MSQVVTKDTWVEIWRIVLDKGARAPQVPADTQQVPLEMKVKGFLLSETKIGQQAEIITPIGRKFTGKLVAVNPAYTHNFGEPIAELLPIGREVRQVLSGRE